MAMMIRYVFVLMGFAVGLTHMDCVYAGDLASTSDSITRTVKRLHSAYTGEKKSRDDLCSKQLFGLISIINVERSKLHFNHIYKEISPEQGLEIQGLHTKATLLEKENNKNKQTAFWGLFGQNQSDNFCSDLIHRIYSYDEKWYAPARRQYIKNRQERNDKLAAKLNDSGDDVYDVIIDVITFRIPRSNVGIGQNRRDGTSKAGVSITFHMPEASSKPNADHTYGDRSNIIALLHNAHNEPIRTYPCHGFDDRDICTEFWHQRRFVLRYQNCADEINVLNPFIRFRAKWRRGCAIGTGLRHTNKEIHNFKPIDPFYDEEVGAWNLNDEAFFKGPIEFPSYWMICDKFPKIEDKTYEPHRKRCSSSFQVYGNLHFEYSFPQRMFWEHEKLQRQMKERVLSFVDINQRDILK